MLWVSGDAKEPYGLGATSEHLSPSLPLPGVPAELQPESLERRKIAASIRAGSESRAG